MMSRRKMPSRAARNALAESPKGPRTQPRRESARPSGRFSYSEDTDSSHSYAKDYDEDLGANSYDHSPSGKEVSPAGMPGKGKQPAKAAKAQGPSRRATRSQAHAPSGAARPSPKSHKTARGIGHPRRAKTQPRPRAPASCPPWPPGLPYHVLLSIFQYAAYPLWDDQFIPNPSAKWLVDAALLRREFADPALSALYYSPPLYPPTSAQMMVNTLRDRTKNTFIDYQAKIRYLDIYVLGTLVKKYGGSDPVSVPDLISVAPQLRGVNFHFVGDNPRFKVEAEGRVSADKIAEIYSSETFDALDRAQCPIRQWKWNYGPGSLSLKPWDSLQLIHTRPTFQRLTSLEISNFTSAGSRPDTKKAVNEEALTAALGLLPNLESLTVSQWNLYMADSVFDNLVPLKKLAFVDCHDLRPDLLTGLLRKHGSKLEELSLSYNPDLNLEFTGELASSCPRLQVLNVDMTFFSSLLIASVQNPGFSLLIPEGCTPTWPRTLRRISMLQLRKWDSKQAEPFFSSLQAAAPDLPDLRELMIKASLEGDWRDRIKFRDTWVDKLTRIFLQESRPPKRHLWSVAERVATAARATVADDMDGEESASERRRLRGSTEEEEGAVEKTHGRCRVVDIRIDNLRPMERQYDESNFLDDEPSGDEDWDGEDDGDDGRYAW